MNKRPLAILPMSLIAELLKVPIGTLSWMHREYFRKKSSITNQNTSTPTLNARASGSIQVTLKNITEEEFDYITCQENQRCWATLSIEKRCIVFHRQHLDRRIKKGVMLKVMKLAGLKRKKVEVCSVPARKEERQKEFNHSTVTLDIKLHDILQRSGHLIFLDECVFKSRDFKKVAWSTPYQNLKVEDRTANQPC